MLSQKQLNYLKKIGELLCKMAESENKAERHLLAAEGNLYLMEFVDEERTNILNTFIKTLES